ncbi:MAG: S8 family serine peptidase [Candidatus Eisenbacteria bacterium]|nr:S8 family serine peptidase [Candidatus Eisenbacteria bacterium]
MEPNPPQLGAPMAPLVARFRPRPKPGCPGALAPRTRGTARLGTAPAPRSRMGTWILLLGLLAASASGAAPAESVPPVHPRCQPALWRLGLLEARTLAASAPPPLRVRIDAGPDGEAAAALRATCELRVSSLRWEGHRGRWAQVTLAPEQLSDLVAIEEIYYVSQPPRPHPLVVSEGLEEIGASAYITAGQGGAGIKVAVLDIGFTGAHALLGSELPADTRMRAFYGSPAGQGDLSGGGSAHGTACAEIVHDVAPEAALYLVNANSATELDAAVRWLREEGVDIISHSVGWFFGPGDGTGTLHEIVGGAIDDEIVWVNAAGNQAQAYWEGDFTDTDSDGWHEFAPGDASITASHGGGDAVTYVLTWDRWPYSSDLAFDLEVRENGLPGASSFADYAGYPYAYRELDYTPRRTDSRLDVRIQRTAGSAPAHLRLFRVDGGALPEHGLSQGSIVLPADGAHVLSVGAYRVGEGFLEEFSSRGPTLAGIAKPEICGPDAVSTASSVPGLFAGTSAACPHVAGALALLLGAIPEGGFFDFRWSAPELRTLLRRSAAALDGSDPNGSLWGALRLPPLISTAAAQPEVRLCFAAPHTRPVHWRLEGVRPGHGWLEIVDVLGRRVARQPLRIARGAAEIRGVWDGRMANGRRAVPGPYYARAWGAGWHARGRLLLLP